MPQVKQDGYVTTVKYKYKGRVEPRFRIFFEYETADGVQKTITKLFHNRTDANTALRDLRREYGKLSARIEHKELTFADYANSYEKTHLPNLASHKQEKPRVRELVNYFGDSKLASITRSRILQFKQFLLKKPIVIERKVKVDVKNPVTANKLGSKIVKRTEIRPREIAGVNRYLERLRHILNCAEADNMITAPSFKGIIDKASETKRTATISFAEYDRLLQACNEELYGQDRTHLKLILIGLWNLGCRYNELQKITVQDIDLENRVVTVWTSKLKNPVQRLVPLFDELYDALISCGIENKSPNSYVFGQYDVKRSWKTVKRIANIEPSFRLHDIRRCFVTNAYQSEIPFEMVKKIVGHSQQSGITFDVYFGQRKEFVSLVGDKFNEFARLQREVPFTKESDSNVRPFDS
ncbi:MAG TPA: tyrosine-type recombinase/integrase [Pyrinomonadaceae bacterium]|jgi:integrase